jgi:cytochrome P450
MFAGVLVVLCAVLAYNYLRARQNLPAGAQLPVGPPGKPVIGNLLQIPSHHSWLTFRDWGARYGDVFRINIAGRDHVIISTEEVANDLLRERGTIYSDREQMPMAAQLLSGNLRPLFLPYGETWRSVRRLMHTLTNTTVAVTYQTLQEQESLRAVHDLTRAPEKYETWFERYSAGLILRLAYSKPIQTGEESFVRRILAVVHSLERIASPGSYLVDAIPALLFLPSFLAPFKREAARLHKEEIGLFRELLQEGVQNSSTETTEDNFCGKWYKNKDFYGISEDQAAYTIGTLFEAGAGTTASAMMSFMLAMTLHPIEYAKLQAEIDGVVGHGRLPSFSDMPSLPRVRAIAKEVLRWRPVTAGGLPHALTQDDVYELKDGRKLFFPAHTNFHPVQWSIHREPKRYPDPDNFRPERWLEEGWPTFKEPLTQHPNLQNFSAFGFGRRICPGMNIAERSLYILISRIAWCCDLSYKMTSEGHTIKPPAYDYTSGFNVSTLDDVSLG